jgi:NAD(P)-dependent dehydrogenase (short-subunit alcohol dehydrogenase family)
MDRLKGKIAVITGGSSGIGLATAKLFVAEGAKVVISGRREVELAAAVREIGPMATAIQGDIADLADLDRLFAGVKAQHGGIDILFANAGLGEFLALSEITPAHFDKTFGTNVRGTLFTVQKALPLLRDGGSIILTGSIASIKAIPAFGVYSATKAALRSFARTWTLELKDRRIRVNVISPGTVDTPIIAPLPKAAIAQLVAAVPMGRVGDPREIAATALFLASDDSSFITGIELFADGGMAQV